MMIQSVCTIVMLMYNGEIYSMNTRETHLQYEIRNPLIQQLYKIFKAQ